MARPLKIPLFLQPIDKPYCGPACLRMVLAFYGHEYSLSQLVSNLSVAKTGIDMCSVGSFLLKIGFYPLIYINTDTADSKKPVYKKTMPRFISQGGQIVRRSIRVRDLRRAVSDKYPVILNVSNGKGGGHFVVIKNIGRKRITINDPWSRETSLSIKRVMRSCHEWTGGAIVVRSPNTI